MDHGMQLSDPQTSKPSLAAIVDNVDSTVSDVEALLNSLHSTLEPYMLPANPTTGTGNEKLPDNVPAAHLRVKQIHQRIRNIRGHLEYLNDRLCLS